MRSISPPIKMVTLAALFATCSFVNASPSEELKKNISSLGEIKEIVETENKGIYAWTILKNGKTKVVYNTVDEKSIFNGPIWRAIDKQNTSNQYSLNSLKYADAVFKNKVLGVSQPIAQEQAIGEMRGEWNGEVPVSLKVLEALAGFKESKADIKDTLYIIYDPRCPWCHAAYESSRAYIDKGISIKWIPTVALGAQTTGSPIAAAILQEPSVENLRKTFAKPPQITVKPTEKSLAQLQENLDYLRMAVKANTGKEQAQVPAGFYLNRRNGQAKMIMGLSEKIVLDTIFGNHN